MSETSVKLSIRKCYVSYCNFSIFRYLHIDLLRTHYINCWKYLIFYLLSLHCEDFFKIDHNEIIYFQSKAYFGLFATADFNSAELAKFSQFDKLLQNMINQNFGSSLVVFKCIYSTLTFTSFDLEDNQTQKCNPMTEVSNCSWKRTNLRDSIRKKKHEKVGRRKTIRQQSSVCLPWC